MQKGHERCLINVCLLVCECSRTTKFLLLSMRVLGDLLDSATSRTEFHLKSQS